MAKDHPYQVRQGGLMRCCLASLDDYMLAVAVSPIDGDKTACRYCGNEMVFRDGAWGWARAEDIANPPEKKT